MTTIHHGGLKPAERSIQANGIDIHYVEAGHGTPLLLVHGGMVSTNPIWGDVPVSYYSHMSTLAQRFRVIAPDTRGCGRTAHPGGTVTFDLLADDVLALIDALGLDRPLIAGFSEGGVTATVAAIRGPESVRAVVNDAGYDLFNPAAPSFAMMRQMLGGSPTAAEADPDAAAAFFEQSNHMRALFALMKADQDSGQGDGYWREYLRLAFHRTTEPPGYTVADLARITRPTLILGGDRDEFCTVEDAVASYQALPAGELAIVPATPHIITPATVRQMIEFFERQLDEAS
jgi:pimeloyl-ACP methyl ester carboxylesterase